MNRMKLGQMVMATVLMTVLSLYAVADTSTGRMELVGVPDDFRAGVYDTKTGVFLVDVSTIEDGLVRIEYEETTLVGKQLEWHTKDDYLRIWNQAMLEQEDMLIEGDEIEYFSEEKRILVHGNVVVQADDAIIYAQSMEYWEDDRVAEFRNQVIVEVEDGTLRGEHFVMDRKVDSMEFFGPFSGEFFVGN